MEDAAVPVHGDGDRDAPVGAGEEDVVCRLQQAQRLHLAYSTELNFWFLSKGGADILQDILQEDEEVSQGDDTVNYHQQIDEGPAGLADDPEQAVPSL